MIGLERPKPYLNGSVYIDERNLGPYMRGSHFGNNNEGNGSQSDGKGPATYIGQLTKKRRGRTCITKVTIEILEVTIIPVFRP